MTITAAADGSSLGNPGPAGWGWYVDDERWACGGWPRGTNNQGELTAVLDLLRQSADSGQDLLIYCDSTYVIKAITEWMPGWKRNGWRKKDGKPVLNVEIMRDLDAAMQGRRVRFEWVKGHAGHELNEHADRLATGAAGAYQAGRQPDPGPGFSGLATSAAPSAPEPDLFSVADADDDAAVIAQVVELERSLLTTPVRTSPRAVAALLHADWSEIGASGRLLERASTLERLTPVTGTLEVISAERIAEHVVLLVWRFDSPDGSSLRSSLWLREDGAWRQRFHQGTREP